MNNIIIDNFKLIFFSFLFLCFYQHASAQNPTMLSSSKNEAENTLKKEWILPQIINENYKLKSKSGAEKIQPSKIHELEKFVLPKNSKIGKIIYNPDLDVPPLAEISLNGELHGYLFETYDWVQGLGYSRKPYHIIAGIDLLGNITGVRIMWHTEPIAILGRTDEDLDDFVEQLQGVNIKQGVNIVLGLSDSVLEGDKVSMRGTAGDTSELYSVDGISRTTTTSLLLNDAVMRAARKVARHQNIILSQDDLGVILNLEEYSEKNWQQLIDDGSISSGLVTNGDVVNKFELVEGFKAPRSARLKKEDTIYTEIFMAIVNPEGIGANILGRRWYDQYVVSGRNVNDLVVWVGFLGPMSFYSKTESYLPETPYYSLKILQDDKEYLLKPIMYKSLPFHHAKKAPDLIEQGLFYFSKDESFDPTKELKMIYTILGDKETDNTGNNFVSFDINYNIPINYINKNQDFKIFDENRFNWKDNWYNKSILVILSIITVFIAILLLSFKDLLVKNRKIHGFVRTIFLLWILVWLGWIAGGQVSIIHLAALLQALYDGNGFASFLAEPAIVIIGLAALISMPIWGRALFCGWLCPFGALQELLNKFAIRLGIKQKKLNEKIDSSLKYGKYIMLLILGTIFIYSFDLGLQASAIEPFKTAITFRFNAPLLALIWVLVLLLFGIFIERAYCRFLCPLGAAAAVLGKVRIFNFLHRRQECGSPCKACNPTCPTQAIKSDGKINMNECFQCLDCQVMYFDFKKCPPLVAQNKNT